MASYGKTRKIEPREVPKDGIDSALVLWSQKTRKTDQERHRICPNFMVSEKAQNRASESGESGTETAIVYGLRRVAKCPWSQISILRALMFLVSTISELLGVRFLPRRHKTAKKWWIVEPFRKSFHNSPFFWRAMARRAKSNLGKCQKTASILP